MNLTMLCKNTFLHDKNAERALKERGTERRERKEQWFQQWTEKTEACCCTVLV